jgi:transcription elongation factor Elf1
MRENKRKKLSNKPTCPACGAVITVRCETWHNRPGRCLRHSNHTGPHYFAAKSIQDDPTFWEALQDPWSVVYFPEPEKVGRDEKGGELERDSRYAGERKLLDLVEGNARVIDEIYCLVDSISKGIALVLTMLERKGVELEHGELEGDPDPHHAVEHPPPAGDGELEHGELEGDPDPRHAVELEHGELDGDPRDAGERKRLSACRHCGSSKVNVNRIRYSEEIAGFKFRYFVICEECGMRGPRKSSSKAASEDWDLLPRIANSRLLDMLEKILSIINKK